MELVIFSKDKCMQCKYLKRELDKNGISYVEKNVSENEDYLREFKEEFNGKNLPMLVRDKEVLSIGFNPDIVEKLK